MQNKRFMFGITCAPEIFQKILENILLPCEGTINFIVDIIVFGSNEAEHDSRYKRTIAVLKKNNVMRNEEKCVYKCTTIKFLGHVLSQKGV